MSADGLSPAKQRLLSRFLDRSGPDAPTGSAIPRRKRDGPQPLSPTQQRIWLEEQLDPGTALHGRGVALTMTGALSVLAYERALSEIVNRHDVLRTRVAVGSDGPLQVPSPPVQLELPVVDLSALPGEDRRLERERLIQAERLRPFSLTDGPLFRFWLVRARRDAHVCFVSMHHFVGDGWSIAIFARELEAAYAALARGGSSPLPPLGVQYFDYVEWLADELDHGRIRSQLAFWRGRLGSGGDSGELPLLCSRAWAQSLRAARHAVRVPPELTRAVHDFARSERVTPFVVLAAAFKLVLQRFTAADVIRLGCPVAGRRARDTEALFGAFINTVVLQTDLSGEPTVRELLGRVGRTVREALDHQDAPFERVVAETQPSRQPGDPPLVRAMINVLITDERPMKLPGLEVSGDSIDAPLTPFDVSLQLHRGAEEGRGLEGWLEYRQALLAPGTIQRMATSYLLAIQAFLADPERRLSDLELLSAEERRRLLREWNPDRRAPVRECVHERIAAQAERTPDAPAVRGGTETWSYAALERRANAVARRLRDAVGPEQRVGVCLAREPGLLAALLGVWKSGAAFVPVDPAYPAERLRHVFDDAGVAGVIHDARGAAALGSYDGVRWPLERLVADWERAAGEPVDPVSLPEGLAYVIYTSGSTGRPKGVATQQAQLLMHLDATAEAYGIEAGGGSLVHSSIGFDLTLTGLFTPLVLGGCAELVGEEQGIEGLGRALRAGAERSFVKLTPAHLELLSHQVPAGEAAGRTGCLVIGGDRLTGEAVAHWRRHAPDTRLYNEYGPTEVSVASCRYEIGSDDPWTGPLPIGNALPRSLLYVLDRPGNPVPVEAIGELCIGGPGVARAYWARPGLTAERFVPDPHSDEPGARMYRTGDLGRWRADGQLEFLGRLDRQVSLRGYRIELVEIEAVLAEQDAVREVAVEPRPGPGDAVRLVAYVVWERTGEAERVRTAVRALLPEYMVPSAWVGMEALPLTPNGKLDRAALPEPEALAPAEYVAPRTWTEELLADIWRDVLGRERIGVRDDFFELGGSSIGAMRVAARARRALGVELSVRNVFDSPTIEALAGRLQLAGDPAEGMARMRRDGSLPLSFAQQRLWFLAQLAPESAAYNMPLAARIEGRLDAAALERALAAIVERHEVLRTRFDSEGGELVGQVQESAAAPVELWDLSGLGGAAQERAERERVETEVLRPLDLARGEVLRARLIRRDVTRHVALVIIHHIVSDDISTAILLRELQALYEAEVRSIGTALPDPPVQYADFAAWQRARFEGEARDEHLAYWSAQLAGLEPLALPADRPRPAVPSFRGGLYTELWSAELRDAMEALARREGATLFMTLLAAFAVVLARHSGQDDLAIGMPISGRTHVELERLIGMFVNTQVLRVSVEGDPSFRDLVQRVREVVLEAHRHQELPFEQLVAEVQPDRDLSRNPLFQVTFQLVGEEVEYPDFEPLGLKVAPVEHDSVAPHFDLELSCSAREDGLHASATYARDLFERATIARLMEQLGRVLEQVAVAPETRMSELELLTSGERSRMLREWNAHEREYPRAASVGARIAAQAERTPDAPAVRGAGEAWTYRALERRAHAVARRLQEAGVRPEQRVGVCLAREPHLLAVLLGVWKTGAAYVPVDPAYPAERVGYVLDDAGVAGVIHDARGTAALGRYPGVRWPLEALVADWKGPAGEPVDAMCVPEALAYVIYTSGSTGRPKGVAIEQGPLLAYLTWCVETYGIDPDRGSLVHSSIGFDLTVTGLFAPLLAGGWVELVGDDEGLEGLARALRDGPERSFVKLTPAHLELLGHQVPAAEAAGRTRCFVIGGEQLTGESVAHWRRHAPDSGLYNEYGATETTVASCTYRVEPHDDWAGSLPVGRAMGNERAYVLDRSGEPLPLGVVGELCLGGTGVARGYWGRPGLTAERFAPDPHADEPGARMYRTGDLGRWRADGKLEFLGRLDRQVKVRGHRIEPGEIEAVLADHDAVREVAVEPRRGPGDAVRLVAYVVWERSGGAESVRAAARARLPEYMVPSAWVSLEALPLTPNGKLDRQALPDPEQTQAAGYVAPRTPTEQLLADIWCRVLGQERIGIHDDFFQLGGDSILAMQVAARAHSAGVGVPVQQLFEAPTIAELAHVAGPTMARAPALAEPGPVPLTVAQRWFFASDPDWAHHFNQAFMFEVDPPLDRLALRDAVARVVERHDALRLRFTRSESGWRQILRGGQHESSLVCVDVSEVPESRQHSTLEAISAAVQAGFDLDRGPLLRVVYVERGPHRSDRLLAAASHLVIDTVSWRILLEDLATGYRQLQAGDEARLLEPTSSFKLWAERLTAAVKDGSLSLDTSYWKRRRDGDAAPLPLDFESGAATVSTQERVDRALTLEATRELLRDVPAAYRTRADEVLLTALGEAIGRWTGSRRLWVDLEGHGRQEFFEDTDVSRTVGWFSVIYPVLLDLGPRWEPREALVRVKEELRGVPDGGVGYGIQRYLAGDRELAEGRLPQVSFNYLGQFGVQATGIPGLRPARESVGGSWGPRAQLLYALSASAWVVDGVLTVGLTFSERLHRRETVERLADDWVAALVDLIAHCRSPEAGALTPTDFPEATLSRAGLESIAEQLRSRHERANR